MSRITVYDMTPEEIQNFADLVYAQTLHGLHEVGLLSDIELETANTQYAALVMNQRGWKRVLQILRLFEEEPKGMSTFTVKLVKVKL